VALCARGACAYPQGRPGAVAASGQLAPSGLAKLAIRVGRAVSRVLARAVGADPHDVGRAAAVEEVPVYGVGQVAAVYESAERLRVLRPVRDEGRLVGPPAFCESDERGQRRADSLDRPRAG